MGQCRGVADGEPEVIGLSRLFPHLRDGNSAMIRIRRDLPIESTTRLRVPY